MIMKRLAMSIVIAVMISGAAMAGHRCNAPAAFDARGGTIARCRVMVTDKRMKGQRGRFQNCRDHAITDSDCEWYQYRNPCWRKAGSEPIEDCYYHDGWVTRPIKGRP